MKKAKSKTIKAAPNEILRVNLLCTLVLCMYMVIRVLILGNLSERSLIFLATLLVMDVVIFVMARYRRMRLNKYKEVGIRYPVDITHLLVNSRLHVGRRVATKVGGTYLNGFGQNRHVLSKHYFLPTSETGENLNISVYVSRENPEHYEVDLGYK